MGQSWKTTLFGWLIIIGDVIKLIADTASEQGVPTDLSGWIGFGLAMATGIGLIFSKDYDKTNSQHPAAVAHTAPEVSASPITVPVVLLAIMALGLTACVSDMDLGNGRVMNLAKVEARSAFGVNDSRSRLRDCLKTRDEQDITSYVYADCHWMESEWRQSTSPGQGGQIVSGALQGIGLGVAGALIGNGVGASANATAGASAVGGKGH